jgi:hypothetical protein
VRIWWSNTAVCQYEKYADDGPVLSAFDDLIDFFAESPGRGIRLDELIDQTSPDRVHARVRAALKGLQLRSEARIVIATVAPPPRPNPPPVLAVAVHTASVPDGVDAEHALLLLAVIPRQANIIR